jgi:hypothetical protein
VISVGHLALLLLATACGLASCAKRPVAVAVAAAGTPAPSFCDTLSIKAKDLEGLLQAPLTHATNVAGDAQSCAFLTTGFAAITVSVRPDLGKASLDAWSAGKMPLAARPLADVGDAAVWQEALHEVTAQKDNLLCDIQVRGSDDDIALEPGSVPHALGALCNRIFAAGH